MRATAGADMLTQRIARQGFVDRPASSAADAARLTGGLQAQDPQASRLGVRSRAQDLTEADVVKRLARLFARLGTSTRAEATSLAFRGLAAVGSG